ncbi:hypothetical protein D3C73_1017780 [compost metagenome]
MLRQTLLHPLQHQDGVGVVVAADKIAVQASLDVGPGPFENQRHGLAAHLLACIEFAAAFSATAVVKVREVELLHVVFAHQFQQLRQLPVVFLGEGGAQAHANTLLAAQLDAVHGTGKAALELTEFVVGSLQAIDTDAHVIELRRTDVRDVVFVDQRAVGGQRDKEPLGPGVGAQHEQVVAQQRFAAGQDQHLDPGLVQVIDHGHRRGGVQFVAKHTVGRGGVTVFAGQVAAPEQVPDHHRCAVASRGAGPGGGRGAGQRSQVLADPQHTALLESACVQFEGRRSPVFFRMRLLTSISSAAQASPSR